MAMLPRTATTPCSVCSLAIAGVSDVEQPSLCESCQSCVSALREGLEEAAEGGVREKDAALVMYLGATEACDALAESRSWSSLLISGGLSQDDKLRCKLWKLIRVAFNEDIKRIDWVKTDDSKNPPDVTVHGERYRWNSHTISASVREPSRNVTRPSPPSEVRNRRHQSVNSPSATRVLTLGRHNWSRLSVPCFTPPSRRPPPSNARRAPAAARAAPGSPSRTLAEPRSPPPSCCR